MTSLPDFLQSGCRMLAERGLAKNRLGGFMAEANRRADVSPACLVAADHAARDQVRVRESFGQRIDATVADIELRKIILPLGQRLLAKLGGEKIHHRLLVRTGSAQ